MILFLIGHNFEPFELSDCQVCNKKIRIYVQLYTDIITDRAMIPQSVWCWAMGWTIRVLGFNSQWGLGIFLFTMSRMALGPTQPLSDGYQGLFPWG
jgi:hypothetical protein